MGALHTFPHVPVDVMLTTIPSLPRAVLARLVDRMIDRLDEIDGDTDLEADDEDQCEAGDDGCAPVYLRGRRWWGSDVEGDCLV